MKLREKVPQLEDFPDSPNLDIPGLNQPQNLQSKLKLVAHVRPFHLADTDAPHAFMLFEFTNRDGKRQLTLVPASLLLDARKFAAHFAERFFYWSEADVKRVIFDLQHSEAPTDGLVTFVPGWHGQHYSRGQVWLSPEGEEATIYFHARDTVKAAPFRTVGTLNDWKELIGKLGSHSSRIRLAISLAFAAVVMRWVDARPFGLNFVGPSSIGKTLTLLIISSVIGTLGSEGLPHLGSTLKAIEEMRLGNRDGVTLADEVGQILGDKKTVALVLKALGFMAGSQRTADRSGAWEKATSAAKADCPTIFAMTSEVPIGTLVQQANGGRLRGEEVRLIDLPAVSAGAVDIFDGRKAPGKIGASIEARRAKVQEIERSCKRQQGHAHVAFIKAFQKEGPRRAAKRLTDWMAEFEGAANDIVTDSSLGRMASSFALAYAAARLAIDYDILPWKPNATRRDILSCFQDAVAELQRQAGTSASQAPVGDDDALVAKFNNALALAPTVSVRRSRKIGKKLRAALLDAAALRLPIKGRKMLLLKGDQMRVMFPDKAERNRLVVALRARGILEKGRDSSTATRQVQIEGMNPPRQAYYVIRRSRLARSV